MSTPLTLYYSPGACSLASHVALEESGEAYHEVRVAIREGANRSDEYLAINPRGRLPALRIGEQILTENPAILLWVGHAFPEAQLLPRLASLEHARVLEWLCWLTSSVHITFAQLWRAERFVGAGAEATLVSALQAQGRAQVEQHWGEIDQRLQGRQFAVGDRFSVVDANLLPFYRWGGLIGLDMRTRYPAWTTHAERMLQRPAVQRVLQRERIELWP